VFFISPAARSVSVLTLLDCTFRANLNLRSSEVFLVLPDFDQRRYLAIPHAPEEVHSMAFAGNIVEQVQPSDCPLENLMNGNNLSGNRLTDSSFVQHSPILATFANPLVRQLP
jgi:hypothetical protein